MIDEHEPRRLEASEDEPAWLRGALSEARSARPTAAELSRLAEKLTAASGLAITAPLTPPASPSGAPPISPSSIPAGAGATAWWTGLSTKVGIAAVLVGMGGAGWLAARAPQLNVAAASSTPVLARPAVSRAEPPRSDRFSPSETIDGLAPRPDAPAPTAVPAPRSPASSPAIVAESTRADDAPPGESEAVLIERARLHLALAPAAALAATGEHAHRYPRGALSQEREVVAVDALLRLGRRDEAEQRINAFRSAFPRSAYLRRLDAMLESSVTNQKTTP